MKQLLASGTSILLSIKLFMTSWAGYFCVLMSIFLGIISEDSQTFITLFIAIFLDMVWGIAAAVKQKQFRLSKLLKGTLLKICIYLSVCIMTIFMSHTINTEEFFIFNYRKSNIRITNWNLME